MNIWQAVIALEGGASASDFESENQRLSAELEAINKEFNSYKTNSAQQINSIQQELDALLEEKAKRQNEQKYNLPDTQIDILKILNTPIENCPLTYDEIRQRLPKIDSDLIALHLDKLQESKLINRGQDLNRLGATVFTRSTKGNEHIIARKLAGKVAKKSKRKHPDLDLVEENILHMLIMYKEGVSHVPIWNELQDQGHQINVAKVEFILEKLREREFIDVTTEEIYGGNLLYILCKNGTEYLYERGKL